MADKNIIKKPIEIRIDCPCGEKANFSFEGWRVNIVGILEFRCPKCNKIHRTKGLWEC